MKASEADLGELNEQLAMLTSELEQEQEEFVNRSQKYALVPYDGPSGTQRPPIYVECLGDRVVLQPENVILIDEDFRAPLTHQNPLAIALRAKREFLLTNGLLPDGMEPYPLIVVRPGSASSYAAVRSAMKAWESEFGYELVESTIELDYPTADPRLTDLLNDVVIEARGRRKTMLALMNQRRSQPREILRPSLSGGFETVSNGRSSAIGRGGRSSEENRAARSDSTDVTSNGHGTDSGGFASIGHPMGDSGFSSFATAGGTSHCGSR